MNLPTNQWMVKARKLGIVLLLGGLALTAGGCASYYEPGYGSAYYAPDYSPYYHDYGYGGGPGFFGGAFNSDFVVGGARHRGYYGSHHLGHDFGGGRGGSFHSNAFHSGGGHFSGRGGGGGHR